MGCRVLEQLNMDWLKPRARKVTNVWLPGWVRRDFHKHLGLESHFQHFEKLGIAKVREISEGEALHIDGLTLRAFHMAQPGLTSFLLRRGRRRALLALDDTRGWRDLVPSSPNRTFWLSKWDGLSETRKTEG